MQVLLVGLKPAPAAPAGLVPAGATSAASVPAGTEAGGTVAGGPMPAGAMSAGTMPVGAELEQLSEEERLSAAVRAGAEAYDGAFKASHRVATSCILLIFRL